MLMTTMMLAGCAREAGAPIDPAPAGFERPADHPLGDADAAAEEHEAARLTRLLEPRFGQAQPELYVRKTPFCPSWRA
jgi:hypothetical protein